MERHYDIRRWTASPPAAISPRMEQPEILVADLRAFFRPLRRGA